VVPVGSSCSARGVVTASCPGSVEVEIEQPLRCAACAGACFWSRLPAEHRVSLPVDVAWRVGASVSVEIPERLLLHCSLLVYGAPLASMLAGAALGLFATGSDLGAAAGALAALAAVLGFAMPLRRGLERSLLRQLRLGEGRPV
jgi:positive regulator of sigma E activity